MELAREHSLIFYGFEVGVLQNFAQNVYTWDLLIGQTREPHGNLVHEMGT